MNINYVKKYSNALGRDMEYKTYGDKGHPVLVFPSQDGRFYDYQDFDMVGVLSSFIEQGKIRLVCADSIDRETWSDIQGDHHRRIELHERWFHYIVDELIPDVRHYSNEPFIVTGCSMGGFHAGNFFFRRPDLFDTLLALSGLYYAGYFFHNYHDPLVYDNSPQDFLRQMPADHLYWDIYRHRRIILCRAIGKTNCSTAPVRWMLCSGRRTCLPGLTTGVTIRPTTGHGGASRWSISCTICCRKRRWSMLYD